MQPTSDQWIARVIDQSDRPRDVESETKWFDMVEDHYLEANGISLHYVAAGEGDPLLFVHGFPSFWYTWRKQIEEFTSSHRVVVPDMRGWGLSSRPDGAPYYGVRVIVNDLRALIEHLGYARVTVVGDDWGGLVSWALALYYPDLVERLIIASSPHPQCFDRELKHSPAQQEASKYLLLLRQAGIEGRLVADDCAILGASVLDLPFRSAGEREIYLQAWRAHGALRAGCDWYRAAWLGPASPDGTPAHGNYVPELVDQVVRTPTLLIKAQGCPYFLDGTVDGLERWVPNLRVEMVPTDSHWIAEERPDVFNAHLRRFVEAT